MPWSPQAGMKCVPIKPLVLAPQMKKVPKRSQKSRCRAARARAPNAVDTGFPPRSSGASSLALPGAAPYGRRPISSGRSRMKSAMGTATTIAAPASTYPTERHPACTAMTARAGRKTSWPVALAAVRRPTTVPRFSTNHRVATVAATTMPIKPTPSPTPTPHVSISSSGEAIREAATVATVMMPSPISIVRRTPIVCISAAANGPSTPKSAMLIATASEMVAAVQPMSASSGSISTPGAERTPAAKMSTRNVKPAIAQA